MGFQNQLQRHDEEASAAASKNSIFLPEVQVRYMRGETPISFRVLPSFNYTELDAQRDPKGMSYLPFRDADGNVTEWAFLLSMSSLQGRGNIKDGTLYDVLSPKTFDAEAMCPLTKLIQYCNTNPEWGYLTARNDDTPPIFTKPANCLLVNIFDTGNPEKSVQLAQFSVSGTRSMINRNSGLINTRSNLPAHLLEENPIYAWAVGDLTDPIEGPLLMHVKDSRSRFGGYSVGLAFDNARNILRYPLQPVENYLPFRYALKYPETFLKKPSEQDIVDILAKILVSRAPSGVHELRLLHEVFPEFEMPAVPPAASVSVPAAVPSGGRTRPPQPTQASGGFAAPAAPAAPKTYPSRSPAAVKQAPAAPPSPQRQPEGQSAAAAYVPLGPEEETPEPESEGEDDVPYPTAAQVYTPKPLSQRKTPQSNLRPGNGTPLPQTGPPVSPQPEGISGPQKRPKPARIAGGEVPGFNRNEFLGRMKDEERRRKPQA